MTSDINGDGKKELVILSGVWLHVFKSNANDEYYLWYLKRENTKDAVQVYDFNRDGRQDFIISKGVIDSLGRGRLKADIYLASQLVDVSTGPILPAAIHLLSNFPSPFNGSTRIRYSLPRSGWVKIRVFDVLAQEVGLLVNDIQEPGDHEIVWDATNVPTGVYFCRLETGDITITRKMLLLR